MNQEIWQQLLSLESRDIVRKWFKKIHDRELNTRRSREINSAAKQAREYFRNANNSDYSVRPLLTFYGVASLSRALLLLLKSNGGEESLKGSHGLETINWSNILSGELSEGLKALGELKVKTCSGLFTEFLKQTNNKICIHVNSSVVNWKLNYDIPEQNQEISLLDLFSRIPDLEKDYKKISTERKYSNVNEMTYSAEKGFRGIVRSTSFNHFKDSYQELGYNIDCKEQWCELTANTEIFSNNLPLLIHTYIHKTFSSIPTLFIAEPFSGNVKYSQLGITYLTSYFLGMLVRYYPTHWISLITSDKGDAMYPLLNRAQHFVENTFPELIIELIEDVINEKESSQ